MRSSRAAVILVVVAVTLVPTLSAQTRPAPISETDRQIWTDFVADLQGGRLSADRVRPAYVPIPTFLQFLETFRQNASWPEWRRTPEVFHVGSAVHFVARLSEKGVPSTYSFTFVREEGRWYLQHFESIVIRLDRVGPAPISTFPDLPDDKKCWIREEEYWSTMVRLFRVVRRATNSDAAFDMFKDGAGYALAAHVWIPLVPPERAFILYLCWEQSRLRGNTVRLVRNDPSEALVQLDSIYLALYTHSGHLRDQIAAADYRRIFDTIWQDRARAAGWSLVTTCEEHHCTLRFTRPGDVNR